MSNQTLIHNELKLSKDQTLAALRIMMLARRTDEKHLMVLKQGKSFFILVVLVMKQFKLQLGWQ